MTAPKAKAPGEPPPNTTLDAMEIDHTETIVEKNERLLTTESQNNEKSPDWADAANDVTESAALAEGLKKQSEKTNTLSSHSYFYDCVVMWLLAPSFVGCLR